MVERKRSILSHMSREERERLWELHLSTIGPHTSREPLGGRPPSIYDEGGRIKYWSEKEKAYRYRKKID
jgi:hypothetical protein